MNNFEYFQYLLKEKGVEADETTLKVLELYHNWLLEKCQTELYEAVLKAGTQEFNRTQKEPFLM